MSKQIPVDILLLNWNKLDLMKQCVSTILQNTEYPYRLVIVDNASTQKGTKAYFKYLKRHKNVKIHINKKLDRGPIDGQNKALDLVTSEYFLFCDNDILIPRKGWLKKMVKTLELDPKIALVCCKLLYPNDTIQYGGKSIAVQGNNVRTYHFGRFKDKKRFSDIREIPLAIFSFVLGRTKYFGKIDDEYQWGYEDDDKSCELRQQGYKVMYNGEVEAYHFEGITHFEERPKELQERIKHDSERFFTKWKMWLLEDLKVNTDVYRERNLQKYSDEYAKRL